MATDASTRGRNNRRRGQSGEREVCALLSDALGVKVKRALGQERDRGTDILECAPFAIEVKRRTRIANLYEWIAQANKPKYLTDDPIPVVALRADGKGWLAVMRFSDWLTLAREEISTKG